MGKLTVKISCYHKKADPYMPSGSYLRVGLIKTKLTIIYLVKVIFLTDVKLVPSTAVASIL